MAICSSAAKPVRPQTQWSLRAKPIPWLSWKSPALLTPSILVRASWWTPQVVWTSSWAVTEIVPRSNFPFRTETYKQSILARVWIQRRICTLAFFSFAHPLCASQKSADSHHKNRHFMAWYHHFMAWYHHFMAWYHHFMLCLVWGIGVSQLR